jgi:hypothetical protein
MPFTTISFGKPIPAYTSTKELNVAAPLTHPLESFRQLQGQISHCDHNNDKSWLLWNTQFSICYYLTYQRGRARSIQVPQGRSPWGLSLAITFPLKLITVITIADPVLWHELSTPQSILKANHQWSNYRERKQHRVITCAIRPQYTAIKISSTKLAWQDSILELLEHIKKDEEYKLLYIAQTPLHHCHNNILAIRKKSLVQLETVWIPIYGDDEEA